MAEARLQTARTVAAYWPLGTEPDTKPLLDALLERGAEVLLPVLMADRDLDWARYEGGEAPLARGSSGTWQPSGATLGPEAVLRAQVVVVPGLAVTRKGVRLGRGGGSYDRVLTRISQAAVSEAWGAWEVWAKMPEGPHVPWTCILLYEDELGALDAAAVEAHDRAVDAACTATRLVEFR